MQRSIQGIHFTVKDSLREHIETKLAKLDYADEYIVDLALSLTREARQFTGDANVHFRWGSTLHVTTNGHEVETVTDQLLDKVFAAVTKEKDRLKTSHSRHGPAVETTD
jgi:putative sigma-54 modulation protein